MKCGPANIAFACISLAQATPAFADTYGYLGKDDHGEANFIDETSVNRMGELATVWVLTISGDYLHGGSPKQAYYLLHQQLNCRTQRIRPLAMSTYTESGVRITSDDAGGDEGPIEPGTFDQDIFKYTCQRLRTYEGNFEFDSPNALVRQFRADISKMESRR